MRKYMKNRFFKYAIPGEIFSQEKKNYIYKAELEIKLVTPINIVKIMNQV